MNYELLFDNNITFLNTIDNKDIDVDYDTFINNVKVTHEFVIRTKEETLYRRLNIKTYLLGQLFEQPFLSLKIDFTKNEVKCKCTYCNYLYSRNNIISASSNYECFHSNYILKALRNKCFCFNYTKDELDNEFEKLEEIEKKKIIDIQKDKELHYLDLLRNTVSSSYSFTNFNLIKLIPVIDLSLDNCIKLSLKIGVDKLYIVKNIEEFLSNVTNKNIYTYGKFFKVNHDISNFDSKSRELIMLLYIICNNNSNFSEVNNNFSDSKKKVLINESILQKILELYTNHNVMFCTNGYYEFNCKVLLDELILKVKIDNDKLTFDNEDISKLIYINGYSYDIVIKNNIVYKVDASSVQKSLLRFVYHNPSFSIKHTKNEFFKDVYPIIADNIVISDELKKNLDVKKLNIKAYFDYEDKDIICNVSYFLDNDSTTFEYLNNMPTLYSKFSKFLAILNNNGFVMESDCFRITNGTEVFNFLKADLSILRSVCDVYLSTSIKSVIISKVKPFNFHLSYMEGMINVVVDDISYTNEELHKIIKSMRLKAKYVRLNKDTIIDLSDEVLNENVVKVVEEFSLDTHHLKSNQVIPLYQGLKLLDNTDKYDLVSSDSYLEKVLNDISHYKESIFMPSYELANIMRDYQIEAYKWLKTLINYKLCGILADDMGLGKSLEIISILQDDLTKKPSLIVAPKSLCYNWTNEFFKWCPSIKVINIIGTQNARINILSNVPSEKVIYVTSYDSLKNDLKYYEDIDFRYVILDEAQYIKNHNTLKAKSVKMIKSDLRFVLTGTPIENSVLDLWSIFDFLMPRYLDSYHAFKSSFEQDIVGSFSKEKINLLVKKITPFVLRRCKKDVLKDLPEKIETIRFAEMEDEQRKVYEAELLLTKQMLESDNKVELLSSLTKLREICVDPNLIYKNYNGYSAKIDLVKSIIEEYMEKGRKILIFSQFTRALDIISNHLKESKISFYTITGSTEAIKRVELANKFNTEDNVKVFLISLKAGGTGLNLTGASVVVHVDPWWNVAAENQASDRAHRIGQKQIVEVIKLVCINSIEQKVIELQEIKKRLSDELIASNDENIVNLSKDDISYILS